MEPDSVEIAVAEVFDLLRWSVFEDASKIFVADDAERPNPDLSPFVGHGIAEKAAIETPRHHIVLTIEILDE